MVDAGSVSEGLMDAEQSKIRNVLLSHAHFDHIKGLPLLADNMAGRTVGLGGSIKIWSLPEVLDDLSRHIFNDIVYPNFTRLPTVEEAPLAYAPFQEGAPITVDGLHVTSVRVNHVVPAVGFIIRDKDSALLFSGDTSETFRIWEMGANEPRLRAAFIETSFPNDLKEVAKISGHLTPEMLGREFVKLGRPDIPVYIYHLKPSYHDLIATELRRLQLPNLHVMEEGQTIRI
jgi:cAMP phosphodiesterase